MLYFFIFLLTFELMSLKSCQVVLHYLVDFVKGVREKAGLPESLFEVFFFTESKKLKPKFFSLNFLFPLSNQLGGIEFALPELMFLGGLLYLLVHTVNAGAKTHNSRATVFGNSLLGFLFLLVFVFVLFYFQYQLLPDTNVVFWHGLFVTGTQIVCFKMFFVSLVGFYVFFGKQVFRFHLIVSYEYTFFLGFILFGIFVGLSANTFLVLFSGLELVNLSLYVIAAIARQLKTGWEAGTKYLMLGSLATGLFAKGVAMLYLTVGNSSFLALDIFELLFLHTCFQEIQLVVITGVIFIVVSFFFKLGVAPFHLWLADVYGGTSLPVTVIFATVVKGFVFLIFANLVFRLGWPTLAYWDHFFVYLGVFSAFTGALGAYKQVTIKRFFAFSSVNHAGFLIVFLGFYDYEILGFGLGYLFVYLLTMFAIFLILMCIVGFRTVTTVKDGQVTARVFGGVVLKRLGDLQNLHYTHFRYVLCLSLLFFSLGGIPPFLGFFPKLALFWVLLKTNFFGILFFFVIVSLISLGYYLRLVKLMFFDKPLLLFRIPSLTPLGKSTEIKTVLRGWYLPHRFVGHCGWLVIFFLAGAPFYIHEFNSIMQALSFQMFYPFGLEFFW